MNESTSNLERLHELNAMDEHQFNAQFGGELLAWLKQFVANELPGLEAPEVTSSPQLRQVLSDLAGNKRAWSQRLASIVIDANDEAADRTSDAFDVRLKEFAMNCPWKFLRESAERKHGRGSPG